uniref:Uncharacterized protein n=1 Tax=Arundo donax TaxID=35708 RepID=A0A0A9F1K3_ARUDO
MQRVAVTKCLMTIPHEHLLLYTLFPASQVQNSAS